MTKARRATVELRRRQDLRMAATLHRDAKKISVAAPEIEAQTDDQLAELVQADERAFIEGTLGGASQ